MSGFGDRLWWVALLGCWWWSWRINRKAEAAAQSDTSGTVTLRRLAADIAEQRRFVGAPMNIRATRTIRIDGRQFVVSLEERAQSVEDEPCSQS